MDPFEVRMTFIGLLSKLTSSLASIQRVSAFALKHGPKCGDDIWDCLVDEASQVNLNARINLLYFLDTLLDKHAPGQPYKDLIGRDLAKLVEAVVPQTREGILNLLSATQVLTSWKLRRRLDAELLDAILAALEGRRESLHTAPPGTSSLSKFSRNDILRRIEDDRERHKRLRERLWVLPVPGTLFPTLLAPTHSTPSSSSKTSPASPSSPSEVAFLPTKLKAKKQHAAPPPPPPPPAPAPSPAPSQGPRGPEVAIEIEFDQLWEASEEERTRAGQRSRSKAVGGKKRSASHLFEDDNGTGKWELAEEDRIAMRRERNRCFVATPP
ncbi:hypothetical protein RQP46_000745 [Phenoliferia psychrophenolica]